ncbi:MAG: lipocalin-like domain-containing protein [Candidatus Accumulibacter meliphilus]|uniref:lipocalin-like domain-containing protein n=1 Tax=Candidatus Accumulibacter meliphilus TaxID=2211374 RepID=UPI002FC32DAD
MRRRSFLCTPLLLPTLALAAPVRPPVAYAPVSRGVELAFPRDHGAHPDFRTEWWYVTGALDSPQADIGFQLTFFRSRPGSAEALRSPLAARQILFAHAALSIPGDRLLHSERAARANLGAGFSSSDCDVHIGAWRMQREDRSTGEVFRLQMQSAQFSYDFTLTPAQPLMLQGDGGYSRKGHAPDLASYYVSWPQLQVAGSLVLDGQRQPASGRAWFDHEWSTAYLGGGAVGWDWVGINLDNGGALMAFRMRDAQGATLFTHAAWRDAHGHVRQFAAKEVAFTPIRNWSSPRSRASYPVQIEIRLGELSVRTRPILDDQELATSRPLPVVYWEGLVRLEGSLSGRGYLEMTGYAGRLQM